MATIVISDELLQRAREVARSAGYPTPERLIEEAIQQKLQALKAQSLVQITQRIRERMQAAGLSEEAILADFERFRESLHEETHL